MTLVEVMLAAAVFVMAALGLYTVLIRAYELAALARYQDNARAVLQTYVDQFQLLWPVGSDSKPLAIFIPTDPALWNPPTTYGTGQGLLYWNSTTSGGLSDESSALSVGSFQNGGSDGKAGMTVTLGSSQNGITATVWRNVQAVDPGLPDSISAHGGGSYPQNLESSGGRRLLLATFTITYSVNNVPKVQQLSVLRADP
jgi:type II secretory pathway pseudopilin PulG